MPGCYCSWKTWKNPDIELHYWELRNQIKLPNVTNNNIKNPYYSITIEISKLNFNKSQTKHGKFSNL